MTDNPTRYGSKLIPDNYHESGSKDFLRPQTKFWALADYFSHVERGVTSSTYFSLLGLRITRAAQEQFTKPVSYR
jgi:hypothetical protein